MEAQPDTARFIREAFVKLSTHGNGAVLKLVCGTDTIAAALVVRHGKRAFFFKIAHDERLGRMSPGVQITLEVTRHLCGDGDIEDADSVAVADHSMINRIWRDRIAIADLLIPTKTGNLIFRMLATVIAASFWVRERLRKAYYAVREKRIA